VAVGTTIADRPPHRSVQARLRIRLLPWMSRSEASIRIGVQNAGLRNPPDQERGETFLPHSRALSLRKSNQSVTVRTKYFRPNIAGSMYSRMMLGTCSVRSLNMKITVAFLILWLLSTASAYQKSDKVYNIYFVPIGDAPTSEIDGLVDHYRQKFGLESTILPALVPGPSEVNPNRHQLIAEKVLAFMRKRYFRYVENNSSILIGITSEDMYPLGRNWQFCFGWRQSEIRSAVVSTARMNLHYEGEPASEANETSRLQKVVTKDIGIMYYNKLPSNNPHSVLFNGILGIEELDQVTEDF